ncbi:MAG: DUF2231 domain-containing protein [Pirellulales bacterium]
MPTWNLPAPWEIHPALVHFPIALLLCGVALDLYAWWRRRSDLERIATGLLAAGVLTGVLAALAGFLAWWTMPSSHTEEAHVLMYWHLGLQVVSIVSFAWVVLVRWLRRQPSPSNSSRGVGLIAAAILVVGAYLGGSVVYHGGAGIDPAILAPELRGHHHGAEGHGHPSSSEPHHDEHEHVDQ